MIYETVVCLDMPVRKCGGGRVEEKVVRVDDPSERRKPWFSFLPYLAKPHVVEILLLLLGEFTVCH